MKRLVLALLLVMVAASAAFAEALVWKAQKGGSTIYLGGTFHVLRETDFPLPPEYEKGYRAADTVVFETDIGALQDPSSRARLLSRATYADGSTIEKHLSPGAYRQLSEYCAANGIPLETLSRLKPSMLMATLTVMELMKLGVTQRGVDTYFYQEAKKDRKTVAGLETVDEQIDYLVTMADGDEDEFVIYSLKEMKTIRQEFENLEKAWRSGNAEKLDELINAGMKKGQPGIYRKLVTDRNRNWLPMIDKDQGKRTRFILVGAAHLVGPDGIIAALKKRGYKVEKL